VAQIAAQIAHSTCWRVPQSASIRPIDERARARHAAVHELLDQGLACRNAPAASAGRMSAAEDNDLPLLHAFVRRLRRDLSAVIAGLSLPYSNGPIEGANTKVKLLGQTAEAADVRTSGLPAAPQRILLS
jgi:transposase